MNLHEKITLKGERKTRAIKNAMPYLRKEFGKLDFQKSIYLWLENTGFVKVGYAK